MIVYSEIEPEPGYFPGSGVGTEAIQNFSRWHGFGSEPEPEPENVFPGLRPESEPPRFYLVSDSESEQSYISGAVKKCTSSATPRFGRMTTAQANICSCSRVPIVERCASRGRTFSKRYGPRPDRHGTKSGERGTASSAANIYRAPHGVRRS